MERRECSEVSIYSTAKVSPGDYYDHETRLFSRARDLEHIKTEKGVLFKFETRKKGFIERSKTDKVLSRLMWVIDYGKETPVDAILIKGRKCLEERCLEVPEDNERCRVLSVFYNYPANLLLCFNEEIPDDVFKTFEGDLHSMCSQPSCVVFSISLADKFVCGYIYPTYSKPGKRFDTFIYGIKEFCSVLRGATVSTLPISAIVDKPSSSYNNRCSGRFRDSVSDGFKTNIKSESNVEVLSETKNTVGTFNSDNIAVVHSNKLIKQGSVGHGITKSSGVKGEILCTHKESVGRGRGTMKGRGYSVGSCTQRTEYTTRVGESRTKESLNFSMDKELQDFCDNFSIELGCTPVKSLNTNSENVKKVTKNTGINDVTVEYLHEQHEKRKNTDMVTTHTSCASNALNTPNSKILTDHRQQTHGLNISCGNQHIDNDCIVSQSDSSDLFRDHGHVNISHPNEQVFRQEVDFYQSNVVEQNKGQVIREEKFDPCNSGSTLTMSEDCNKKLHEDNVNKSKRGSASYSEFPEDSNDKPAFHTKEENQPANKFLGGDIKKSEYAKSQDTKLNHSSESRVTMKESSLKNSGLKQNCNSTIYKTAEPSNKLPRSDIKKSEDDNRKSQVTKEKDTSESKGTIKESSSKKSTRSQNCNSTISANAELGNEIPKGDVKKSEYDDRKSQDTKEKDTNKSKVTVKETDSKKRALRHNCNSTISENAKKKMGHNKETKKSKNAEKKVDPNIYSRVETNNVRPKKLIQGLRNEDQNEKSYLKIGNQDNYKVKTCKEKPQMKSTFLEADKTADDMLGFQRKYYGVVNDTSLEKMILLLGASGSGKTTLVNLAANYFKEKKSADEELYHVVTSSPTSEITAYTFCSAPDEIPITIIDTPGLNDSSGAEVRDHIQSLKTFLANASASEFQIHAIGFVAQAYLVRLTSSERLVMDYVSTIFGQGVKDHLITLVTFADNQDNPPVVEAMKNYGVSFKLSLKFNNSALHNNKAEEVDDIDRVYWRICWRNWKKCMKTLRDLSPLSVSTMKAVHSEVFASTILKSTERDLTGNLKTFFGYSKEDRISSKEARKVCAEIWNLAAVLQHFRSLNNGLHNSREDILIEFAAEICKAKQIFDKENICFLSLNPDTPLIISGLQVIRTMESLYKQSKSLHTKSNTFSKNVTEWTHCHCCDDDHKMERLSRGILEKLTGFGKDVVALKCIDCRCPGEVHGVSETRSPFHPDIVIEKTYTALQNVIHQYSMPNFPIPEDWYLKFLNQLLPFEYTDFMKDIYTFVTK
ncbi:uncharacterized protein [Palaemon carinicauda]|uniref:uncharacterized protein n=1 Tax=Palaemon carinicauda TaxID=392227 RepID=UPI0035B65403